VLLLASSESVDVPVVTGPFQVVNACALPLMPPTLLALPLNGLLEVMAAPLACDVLLTRAPYPLFAALRSAVAEANVKLLVGLFRPLLLSVITKFPPLAALVLTVPVTVASPEVTDPAGKLANVTLNGGVEVSDVCNAKVAVGVTVAAEAMGPNALPVALPCKAATSTLYVVPLLRPTMSKPLLPPHAVYSW